MAEATLDTLANQPAEAVGALKKAVQKGQSASDIEADPEFTPLRGRSDYQELIKQYPTKK